MSSGKAVLSGSLHLAFGYISNASYVYANPNESRSCIRPSVIICDRTPRLGCDRCVAPSFIDLATRSPMSLHYISFITLPMPQRGNAIVLASSEISGCSTIVTRCIRPHVKSSRRLSIIGCVVARA